jgi:serine/threonine protein kinase
METPQQGAGGSPTCSRYVSAEPTVRVDTRMGDYQLKDVIGEGTTGVVYRGRHVVTDVQVAIKVLHAPSARTGKLVEQLVGGARAAGAVQHANLVAVIDSGSTPEGTVFVVTEHLEGESLQARLGRVGRLPLFEAINILRQMAHGVGAAHESGLVHGGVKPSNIFLCRRKGRRRIVHHSGAAMHLEVEPEDSFDLVKLLDVGVAGVDFAAQAAPAGTPHYGSPEQAEGKPAEPCSDIYSLGAVFYEMVTGTAPFRCKTPADLLGKHLAGVVTMASRRAPGAGIDGQVDDIIWKCLKKKPRLRFANTAELCEALDACVADCAFVRDAYPGRPIKTAGVAPPEILPKARLAGATAVTKPAVLSMTTKPARAQGVARHSPPPIPHKRPVARGRAQPPPIPRAAKATSAPAQRVPPPNTAGHSAVARGTPPPIPLTSDLLTELPDQVSSTP